MTVTESAAFLRQHDNYLILTHKRPDGDTIGCAAALCEGLRALGRTAWICPHAEETHLFTPYLEQNNHCRNKHYRKEFFHFLFTSKIY